jgi:uncharacterized protein
MKTAAKSAKRPSDRTDRPAAARRELARLRAALQLHLPELKARYQIASLGVFGSYVRGQARGGSDLDVLVEFDVAPSFFEFIDLEERLGNLAGLKVDLVMKSALRPKIGERILAEVVPI